MSLSEKSDSEISALLTQYGIKHGPIVGSTRKLYERKLEKAMEASPETSSSDKTFYREEEEEVTYITYHSSPRYEGSGDMLKHRGTTESNEQKDDDEEETELDKEPPIQNTARATHYSAVQSKGPVKKTQRSCLGKTIRLLLVLALLAAVSYYVFCHVMSNEESQGLQQ